MNEPQRQKEEGWSRRKAYFSGGQEFHAFCHLETIANQILQGQRSLVQILSI